MNQKLSAEVASSPPQHTKGLSGRPCIQSNQAMLFIFGKSDQYKMWMKDMKFPIDILWISAEHKVVAIERDVSPDTYPDLFINKDRPALYVLEMKARRSIDLGVNLDTQVNF